MVELQKEEGRERTTCSIRIHTQATWPEVNNSNLMIFKINDLCDLTRAKLYNRQRFKEKIIMKKK